MLRVSETTNYYRLSFWDGAQMTNFKTVRLDDAYAVVAADPSTGHLYVQSVLLPKNKYDINSARIKAFYYKGLFEAKE